MSVHYLRAFPTSMERTGPRQLTGRLVPYDEAVPVVDELPDGGVDFYREGFRPGSFPQAASTEPGVIRQISLIHRHEGGLGFLGPFTALRSEADGLYGDVSILRSRADDVDDLLGSGVSELSIEFALPKGAAHTEVDDEGVRWRVKAHLHQVALEPKGAYSSAQVLAFRAEADAALQEAEAARLAEVARDAAASEAAEARRRRWQELTGRLEDEKARQAALEQRLGITRAGGLRPTLADAVARLDDLRT